jgi:hypothetical protein
LITIAPKHSKQNPRGFHDLRSSRGNHRDALEMANLLVQPAMVVFDAALRPTALGAEPSELRQLDHEAHAPSQAAVANHDSEPSIFGISADSASCGAIFYSEVKIMVFPPTLASRRPGYE